MNTLDIVSSAICDTQCKNAKKTEYSEWYDEGFRDGLKAARGQFFCDRDELLQIAEEIWRDSEYLAGGLNACEGNFTQGEADEYYKISGYAKRIREACGVYK